MATFMFDIVPNFNHREVKLILQGKGKSMQKRSEEHIGNHNFMGPALIGSTAKVQNTLGKIRLTPYLPEAITWIQPVPARSSQIQPSAGSSHGSPRKTPFAILEQYQPVLPGNTRIKNTYLLGFMTKFFSSNRNQLCYGNQNFTLIQQKTFPLCARFL